MRVALIAPLVSAIREPQRGGSQVFVSDLARGLAARGHDVQLYAASGSEVPGVEVIDTGVDPGALQATLYRASGGTAACTSDVAERAFGGVYEAVRREAYDVVHNHAFDAPAVTLATTACAPVVHTLHLPPDAAVADALRDVARRAPAPTVAGVSAFQASAWSRVIPVDAILQPYIPTKLIRWSPPAAANAVVAFRRGALDEIVVDGVTGWMVAPDDINAAADAVTRASELSRSDCREHAESHLDLELSLDAHEGLYRRVAGAGVKVAVGG